MTTHSPTEVAVLCSDRFDDDRPPGTVLGSIGPEGARRQGVDVEGLIAIDNGALRLQPLARPGWGREGIAYGPFPRQAGLAFAAHVLNGHNSSQTYYFPESRRQRIRRILGDVRRLRFGRQHHYENLAVGFLPDAATTDPVRDAHSFVMHAATADNGELWVATDGRPARAVKGVLNVPIVFVVALREKGAAYYTASVPGATGAGDHPWLQPMGLDTASQEGPFVAAVQQRILGEVGYRVDTRIYGVRVAEIDAWSAWYGTAHAADRLTGAGEVDGRAAELGGRWRATSTSGRLVTSAAGARAAEPRTPSAAVLGTGQPVGLLHAVVSPVGEAATAELQWRVAGGGGLLAVVLDRDGCRLVARHGADEQVLANDPANGLRVGTDHSVQVLDNGSMVSVHVDGRLVGDGWWSVADYDDPPDGMVGIALGGDVAVRDLEAHPRRVELPADLECGTPWTPEPSVPCVDERFDLVADDLHGVTTPSGGRLWERAEGVGSIELLGDGARVRANREHPNPGRTIFTIPWDEPDHADLTLDMTMPGTRRGERHGGRCGVVFWQDPDNYLVVNFYVDDDFDGASVSTFYHLNGAENMYDAVWTLVRGVEWGKRCALRTSFDGERFLAWSSGEPALVRALTDVYPDASPLRIERVGIIVNYEWGDDTGTLLHRFTAGRRDRP
jgi:hypothetical protein